MKAAAKDRRSADEPKTKGAKNSASGDVAHLNLSYRMSFGQVTYPRAAVGKANQILHRKFEPCPEQSHVLRFGGLRVEVGPAFSIRAAMGDRPWIVGCSYLILVTSGLPVSWVQAQEVP